MATENRQPGQQIELDPSAKAVVVFSWDDDLAVGVSISGSATFKITPILPLKHLLSITRSSTTATATTGAYDSSGQLVAAPHGLTTGQYACVSGAAQAEYNITAQITVTGVDTFTYTVSGSPVTPATGTIVYGAPSLSKDNEAIVSGNRKARVRLDATTGVPGDVYEVACNITTDETPSNTDEQSIRVLIQDQ